MSTSAKEETAREMGRQVETALGLLMANGIRLVGFYSVSASPGVGGRIVPVEPLSTTTAPPQLRVVERIVVETCTLITAPGPEELADGLESLAASVLDLARALREGDQQRRAREELLRAVEAWEE